MSGNPQRGMVKWWAMILVGTAAALLFSWLGRLAGVPLSALLSIAAGGVALAWLILLVTVPWNLYFAAHQAVADIAASRERGIGVKAPDGAEAGRIARRMLWFAVGAHLVTAGATTVITYVSGATVGYYFAGFYLLATIIRPALAYLGHVRARITALTQENRFPRDDVATMKLRMDAVADALKGAQAGLSRVNEDLRHTEATLAGDIAHASQVLTADLARVQDAQAADRAAARAGDDNLGRRIDQIARQVEAALDGLGDHQDLLTGLRALVRLIRSEPA